MARILALVVSTLGLGIVVVCGCYSGHGKAVAAGIVLGLCTGPVMTFLSKGQGQ